MATETKKAFKIPVLGIDCTFNQLAAFIIILVIIHALLTHPAMTADTKQALFGVMMLCAGYIWGSSTGSHAKDDALANSTPIPKPLPEATTATTTTTTTSEQQK